MGRDNLESKQISVNEFLNQMKKAFGDFEFRATSKDGKVFKSQGFDK